MLYSRRGLLMHPALIAVIVIAVIVIVVIRRFRGEPVDAKDLAVSPVILLAISVKARWDFDHWPPGTAAFPPASIVVGLGLGCRPGASPVRSSQREPSTRDTPRRHSSSG